MDYGYSNPWGMALQQPMGGLMSPFTPWGLGAVGDVVQPQEATTPHIQRVMGEGGDGHGYSSNDGQVMDRGPTTPNDISSRQGMMGALGGYGLTAAKNTAIDTAAAYAGGFAPTAGQIAGRAVSNLAHPGAVMGLAGDVIGQQMGMTAPAGVFGKVARNVISPAITGLLSVVNPALGIAYGLMSPMVMDALGDMTNTRKDENYKDAFEEKGGYFGGRVTSKEISNFADRAGFDSLGHAYGNQGYGPADAARGMTNKDASSMARGGNPMGNTYGANRGIGFSNSVGGPKGGARAVDSSYGRNMGGFAGLGIGNPSSHGGGKSSGGSGGKSTGGPGRGGRGDSTGTGGGYSDGKGGVSGL